MKNAILILALLLGLTACTPAVAAPTSTAATETFVPTTEIDPTLTPTPEFTPTATIERPSIDAGFTNPDNKATPPIIENGTWVVKNGDGLVMATWNNDTESWVYTPENIKVQQVFIGSDVDRSVIEPFLAPLPPDDPATHFRNTDGTTVDAYGIGPVIMQGNTVTIGLVPIPTTEIFVRFRGAVPFVYNQLYGKLVAQIFEVPLIDTSIIIVRLSPIDGFYFQGSLDDNPLFDHSKASFDRSWFGESGIQIANSTLKGKQAIVLYYDTLSPLVDPKSPDHDFYAEGDAYSHQLIDFISGKSNQAPALVPYTHYINTFPMILFPDSQVPKK